MKRSSIVRLVLSVVLLAVAVLVLRARLGALSMQDIRLHLGALPNWRVVAAVLLTCANYLQLTLYDEIGLIQIQRKVPYRKVLLTSFVATAFGHNIGPSFASGGSVRYRFYSALGLSAREVAELVGRLALTFLVGFCCAGGIALLTASSRDPFASIANPALLRTVGAVLSSLGFAYMAFAFSGRSSITIGRWQLPSPGRRVALMQLFVASVDWLVMAAIITLLLPGSGPGYFSVLRTLLIAQVAGMLSQVPGGLGVFESMMVTLTPGVPPATLLGALVIYRCLYFFGPFALAILLFAASELSRRLARRRQLHSIRASSAERSNPLPEPRVIAGERSSGFLSH
jgi:uncharacterized membrane protein YbhN (UPF0104 family)